MISNEEISIFLLTNLIIYDLNFKIVKKKSFKIEFVDNNGKAIINFLNNSSILLDNGDSLYLKNIEIKGIFNINFLIKVYNFKNILIEVKKKKKIQNSIIIFRIVKFNKLKIILVLYILKILKILL